MRLYKQIIKSIAKNKMQNDQFLFYCVNLSIILLPQCQSLIYYFPDSLISDILTQCVLFKLKNLQRAF